MRRISRFSVGVLLTAAMAAQTPAPRKGVSVRMAVSSNAVAVPDADLAESLVVTVTYDSRAFLDVSLETPAELAENVKARLAGQPGKRVYFKGDARTPYSTVANVLGALRSAGVDAPILLTSQDGANSASYRPPIGLEVLLRPTPGTGRAVTLKTSDRQASDAELRQQAGKEMPIVLEADRVTPFGDVVHAVDVLHGEGASVFLALAGQSP